MEVDAATNTKVDEMRELLDTAAYMPVAGRFKVYLIDEVHMLSRHAFNSMLKTLEEPPEHVKFILATTDPQRLPVTILSRCLQFNLKPLTPQLIAGHLKHVLTEEKIPFEEPALALLAKAAAGSIRDSLSLLDQAIAHGAGKVAAAQVADMLGSLGADLVWPILERIASGDGKGTIEEAERIAAAKRVARHGARRPGLDPASRGPRAGRCRTLRRRSRCARASRRWRRRSDAGRVQVMYQIALLGRRDLSLAPDELAGFHDDAATHAVVRRRVVGGRRGAVPAPQRAAAPVAARCGDSRSAAAPSMATGPASSSAAGLTGMSGMAARNAEFVSFENNHLQLRRPGIAARCTPRRTTRTS